jgi:hypothetical protein
MHIPALKRLELDILNERAPVRHMILSLSGEADTPVSSVNEPKCIKVERAA